MGNGRTPIFSGGTGGRVGSAGRTGGDEGRLRSRWEAVASQVGGVSLEEGRPGEAPGRSISRFARGPVAARATEADPAETAVPGTTSPSVTTSADCVEQAKAVPLVVRSGAEVPPFWLTDASTLVFESTRLEGRGERRVIGKWASARYELRGARERQWRRKRGQRWLTGKGHGIRR